ncbi:probable xyloglucan endotransglucosylase/hydrolase protein 30 [Nymphaea colorata]|nr:probable xyloglucan endotransglucosylase/hydrolase protein 30 [Nymphaea colorata]
MTMTATMAESATTCVLVVVCLLSFSTFSLASFNFSTLAFGDAYSPLFGHHNIHRSSDDKTVQLGLERSSGSGFISKDMYHHGFFSAKIKLPSDYTAGVVVAFYTSNGDVFRHTHDELDWEFLGNIKGEEWRVQTNVYGNGSTGHGREERYLLWFDPTKEFHRYSILWTSKTIIFYVDDVPIREVVRTATMGGDYPSKPMSLYATIWDGSTWATLNGRYKADYKYAPFVAEFTDFVLQGCAVDTIQQVPEKCNEEDARFNVEDLAVITPEKRAAMQQFRQTYMAYSHCYDRDRYPNPMPECLRVPEEEERFKSSGHLKIPIGRKRHSRRRSRTPAAESGHRTKV